MEAKRFPSGALRDTCDIGEKRDSCVVKGNAALNNRQPKVFRLPLHQGRRLNPALGLAQFIPLISKIQRRGSVQQCTNKPGSFASK